MKEEKEAGSDKIGFFFLLFVFLLKYFQKTPIK